MRRRGGCLAGAWTKVLRVRSGTVEHCGGTGPALSLVHSQQTGFCLSKPLIARRKRRRCAPMRRKVRRPPKDRKWPNSRSRRQSRSSSPWLPTRQGLDGPRPRRTPPAARCDTPGDPRAARALMKESENNFSGGAALRKDPFTTKSPDLTRTRDRNRKLASILVPARPGTSPPIARSVHSRRARTSALQQVAAPCRQAPRRHPIADPWALTNASSRPQF